MRTVLTLAFMVAVSFAGCTTANDVDSSPVAVQQTVEGVVVDALFVPVPDATVEIPDSGRSTQTDDDGRFVLVVDNISQSRQVHVRHDAFMDAVYSLSDNTSQWKDIRIQVERVPVKVPFTEFEPYNGFIPCSALVVVGHSHGGNEHEDDQTDCSLGAAHDNVWVFDVRPDLANAAIEVRWEPHNPTAQVFSITMEAVGTDDGDVKLYFAEGTSPLRANIGELQASRYFDNGGTVRITVEVAGPESDVVASAAVNQEFEAIAALFYVAPGPTDYSFDG